MKMNPMNEAWKIANTAAENFGGKPSEYIAESLVQGWENFKDAISQVAAKLKETFENATIEEIELFINSNKEILNNETSRYNRIVLKAGIKAVKELLASKQEAPKQEEGETVVTGIKDWFMIKNLTDHERYAVECGDIEIIKETEKSFNLKVSCKMGNVYLWVPKSVCLTNVA